MEVGADLTELDPYPSEYLEQDIVDFSTTCKRGFVMRRTRNSSLHDLSVVRGVVFIRVVLDKVRWLSNC